MEIRTCITCNQDKPLVDYYVYPDGNHHTRCKKCQIKFVNTHAKENGNKPHAHELECLNYLHRHGIPTMEGKYLKHDEFKRIDLVSFGIIKVEVKQANPENKIWFSVRQRENFRSDVVIVRTVRDTYHVFPPDFHEFIRKKTGKRYVVAKISDFALGSHIDRVQLIHNVLVAKQAELITAATQVAETKAA